MQGLSYLIGLSGEDAGLRKLFRVIRNPAIITSFVSVSVFHNETEILFSVILN